MTAYPSPRAQQFHGCFAFLPLPAASSLQPHHHPKGPMCFPGPHADPKYPRHNSKFPNLRDTPSAHLLTGPPAPEMSSSLWFGTTPTAAHPTPGVAQAKPHTPAAHNSNLHVYCGTFIFLTMCCWGLTVSHDSKKTKICHLKELGTKTLHKLKG